MQGNGKKPVEERSVCCVMLLPSGGQVPEDLLASLRNRRVSVTTVASPASLMAELGLREIEFRQRRSASSLDVDLSTSTPEGGSGEGRDDSAGESKSVSNWREPLIMLVVEPDKVPDLAMISDAVTSYFPLVLKWSYAENANPRLGPLRVTVDDKDVNAGDEDENEDSGGNDRVDSDCSGVDVEVEVDEIEEDDNDFAVSQEELSMLLSMDQQTEEDNN